MATKIIAPIKGFSDAFIKRLKPQANRYELADNACSGLRLRIGTSGKKSFIWLYKTPGTNKINRLTLGSYPTISLADARKALESAKIKHLAGELNTSFTTGMPKTVNELCDLFYKERILPHRRSPKIVLQVINHDIKPVIGSKSITTISTVAVANVVTQVVGRGAVAHAGKVTGILKQLFKFAEGRGYIDRSPAYALDKKDLGVVHTVRERWLATEEIEPVWKAINNYTRLTLPTKNALLILMLTGLRTGELLKAKWENIDLNKKEWLIPGSDTKTLEEWAIPLTNETTKLLLELQGLDAVYVFPGKKGMLSNKVTCKAMNKLFDTGALTIEKVRPHDFRRTIRTHLEQLNVPPHIAEKCLNHSLGTINATYNKNSYLDERREALQRWNEFVMLQVNPKPNVVSIKRAS